MLTNFTPARCETRSIAIAAAPHAAFRFVSDARNLPRWAPGFASEIHPDGDRWLIGPPGRQAAIVVVADSEHGTVDILADADRTRGAFTRIVPNGAGSEMLFTLFFAPGTDEGAVARQMAIVDAELAAVRAVVESG